MCVSVVGIVFCARLRIRLSPVTVSLLGELVAVGVNNNCVSKRILATIALMCCRAKS